MKEKLKITRNDLTCFYKFAEDNDLKFVEGITKGKIYSDSIYLSNDASTSLCWDDRTSIKNIKLIIKMLNILITSHELYLGK